MKDKERIANLEKSMLHLIEGVEHLAKAVVIMGEVSDELGEARSKTIGEILKWMEQHEDEPPPYGTIS